MFKQRILIQFSVTGDIRFISHHDLMRVLGRALRRAQLPVAMSEGFNPRLKLSLLLARAVGVASEAEFAEVDLNDWVSALDVARRLDEVLPEGLRVERAVVGDPGNRRTVCSIEYAVEHRQGPDVTAQDARDLLAEREVVIERIRRKAGRLQRRRLDIRPFISDLQVLDGVVRMLLKVSDKGTTRVEEVWQALGRDPAELLSDCTVKRTAMHLSPSI